MIAVTVLPMIDVMPKPGTPLVKVMNDRLTTMAGELQKYLEREFTDEKGCEDLVIYMSYNSKYAVRWKTVNDVPVHIQNHVTKCCGNLGYIQWKELDLYSYKVNRQSGRSEI
ncbi:hypothetical protein N824_01990 [Pedobacter sp. V48]|nr:hypothetical protein N824_01990 [Pedobacter sp. V48]